MGKYRTLSKKNKYYIPKEDYLTAIHYSLRYPLWLAEIETGADTRSAIRYDVDHVQTSNGYDSTQETAIRMSETIDKVNLIDGIIQQVTENEPEIGRWIRLGVCYGLTFEQLKQREMPCERDMYYEMRQKYYYLLSKKI